MRFAYHTDSTRGPLLMTVVLVIGGLLTPVILFRLVLLAVAAGPGVWALLQWRRSGRGVQVTRDHVLIQGSLTGRARCIAYTTVRGYTVTPSGSLLLAYRQADPPPMSKTARSPALTDLRPESHQRPRYALIATPPLDDAEALQAALDSATQGIAAPADRVFLPEQLRLWARSRRIRNLIVAFLLVMATPLYMIILGRTLAGFLNIVGGNNFGR